MKESEDKLTELKALQGKTWADLWGDDIKVRKRRREEGERGYHSLIDIRCSSKHLISKKRRRRLI